MDEPPDAEAGDDVERTMGEIWETADSVDQSKTNRHQSQRKTVDDSVNEDIHNKQSMGNDQLSMIIAHV